MLRNGSKSLRISSVGLLMLLMVSFAATLMQPSAAQAGGFSDSCTGEQVVIESGKALLKAECKNRDGQKHPSSLVISDYVANYSGKLEWVRDGNFQLSCSNIRFGRVPSPSHPLLPDSEEKLVAKCGNGKGGYELSTLNLNEKISNQNGVLAVDDF